MPDLKASMFEWTPEYAVGFEEIDREHQRLFALAEDMHRAMLAAKGKQILAALLADLLDYTCYHFLHEEQLMERLGYPGLKAHRRQHHTLRAKVRAMQGRAAAGEVTMTIEVAHFLIQWLKQHTIASDRLIAEHLNALKRPA